MFLINNKKYISIFVTLIVIIVLHVINYRIPYNLLLRHILMIFLLLNSWFLLWLSENHKRFNKEMDEQEKKDKHCRREGDDPCEKP